MDKKTGLYFGSFNPIHIGHLMIANYMVEFTDLAEVWFVISPHNPLKKKSSLLEDHHRYYMVQMAVENDARFRASNIEFNLPQPSFTIDTLTYLSEKYPTRRFALISGADIFSSLHKWKNYRQLIDNYAFYVYPRPDSDPGEYAAHKNVIMLEAPQVEISASFIRKAVQDGKDIRYYLPEGIFEYIREMHFYEK